MKGPHAHVAAALLLAGAFAPGLGTADHLQCAELPVALSPLLAGAACPSLTALPGTSSTPDNGQTLGRYVVTLLYRAHFSGSAGGGYLFVDFGDQRCGLVRDWQFLSGAYALPQGAPSAAPLPLHRAGEGSFVDCATLEPRGTFLVMGAATDRAQNGFQILVFDHRYPGPGNYLVRWQVCCEGFGGQMTAMVLPSVIG